MRECPLWLAGSTDPCNIGGRLIEAQSELVEVYLRELR